MHGIRSRSIVVTFIYYKGRRNNKTITKTYRHAQTDKTVSGLFQSIRTSDYSYARLFVLWVDYSYLGRFV